MVREPESPALEPENRSGTPESRLLPARMRSLGAFPGNCWYHFAPKIQMYVLPEQEMVTFWPRAPETEGGCVSTAQDLGRGRDTVSVMIVSGDKRRK